MTQRIYEISSQSTQKDCMITCLNSSSMHIMKRSHTHDHYEILHVCTNSRMVYVNNQTYLLSDNSIAMFKPKLEHYTAAIKPTQYNRYILSFTPNFAKNIVNLFHIDLDTLFSCPVCSFSDIQIANIEDLFKKLLEESTFKIPYTENPKFILYFTNILILLSEGIPSTPFDEQNGNIYAILQYIEQNYTNDISLGKVANRFFISKSDLCHKLKSATGKTFSELVAESRIKYACHLLITTTLTIAKISLDCGYNTLPYFLRQFKKIMLITPTVYRKQQEK